MPKTGRRNFLKLLLAGTASLGAAVAGFGVFRRPPMHVGLVYGTASRFAHRTIIPETFGENRLLLEGWPVRPDESIALIDATSLPTKRIDDVLPAIEAAHGIIIRPPPRCVVVDNAQGTEIARPIVDAIMADPHAYKPPGRTVIAHGQANIGWTYNPAARTLQAPPSVDPYSGQVITHAPMPVLWTEAAL